MPDCFGLGSLEIQVGLVIWMFGAALDEEQIIYGQQLDAGELDAGEFPAGPVFVEPGARGISNHAFG